jgi:PAS domain S-box-containing protein
MAMSFENYAFSLFMHFPHPVFLITPDGTILEANQFFVNRFSLNDVEIRGKNVFELISSAFHDPELAAKRKAMADSVVSTGQHLIFCDEHVDGMIYRNSVYPVKSPDGTVTCLLIIVHDVTEQVEAERQARHTEHIFKALFDAVPGSVFILDDECLMISCNRYAFDFFGDWKGKIRNNNFCNLVFSEDRPLLKKLLTDLIENGHEQAEELRMHTHEDRNSFNWFSIHARKAVIDNRNYLVLVCLDIHQIKTTELRLFEYKKWLIKAMEAGNAGVWDWNIASNTGMWSNKLWELFGIEKLPELYPTFELWESAIHPDDREIIAESVKRAISLLADLSIEYRVLRPDGSCRWLFESAKPVYDKHGEVKRYCGIVIDITDQKKFETEISLVREHFDVLLEKLHIGWFHTNLRDNSTIRTIEHARIFGYDSLDADWSFDRFLEHIVDEERERVRDTVVKSISNNKDFTIDFHIRKASGEIRKLWSSGSFICDDHGKPTHIVGVVQDTTDRQVGVLVEAGTKNRDKMSSGAWG